MFLRQREVSKVKATQVKEGMKSTENKDMGLLLDKEHSHIDNSTRIKYD